MVIANFIRGIVKKHPELKLKLKQADSKLSGFQYVYQTLMMTIMSFIGLVIILYIFLKSNIIYLFLAVIGSTIFIPILFQFWFSVVNVQITKLGREIDGDLLFVSEYLLVSLESGLPLGNAIENLSRINRPGGRFFKRIYTEFKTGKSFNEALEEGSNFSASRSMKILIKKLKDSMDVGIDLRVVLETYINDSSDKKIMEVKTFAKKLNPIVMMYLLLGIVIPSLGVTFFILGAALMQMTPQLLKVVLMFIFIIMFGFQYMAYTSFKFNKSTL